jgi:uncharacterized protein (TIGR02246 family)
MKKLGVAIVVIAIAGFTSPGRTQGKTDPALDKLGKEFMAAFNAQDAAKVASFYAEDAVLMPPNVPLAKGRAAIEAQFKRDFQQGASSLQLRPIESTTTGGQAFEAGTSTVTIKTGATTLTDNGKYLTLFKRVGNDWKISHDIFNSDQAPPPPPSPKK